MSLFNQIRAGNVTLEAFQRQLLVYQAKRAELVKHRELFGPDLFKSTLRDLELSISFTQIFLDKFNDIKQTGK